MYGVTSTSGCSLVVNFTNGVGDIYQSVDWHNQGSATSGNSGAGSANSLNVTLPSNMKGINTSNWLIKISNYTGGIAGRYANLKYETVYTNDANTYVIIANAAGRIDTVSTAISSITFNASGNSFTGGTVKIYGVK